MTITYPLSLPDDGMINSFLMRFRSVSSFSRSPYTGEQYTIEYPGQWFEADVSLVPMYREEAQPWRAFFTKLRGVKGTFLMGDPACAIPLGAASLTPGTPQVNGGNQTGGTLAIKTGLGAVSNYLKAGDYIQLGSGASTRLHMNLNDADLDETGNATLDIWPDLRESPDNNATIVVSNCKGLFRFPEPYHEDTSEPLPIYDGRVFSVVEAL